GACVAMKKRMRRTAVVGGRNCKQCSAGSAFCRSQKPKYSFSARRYRSHFDGGHLLKAKLSTTEDFRQSQKVGAAGEKGRLIRDPISIRPTVTAIFANRSTFGCDGRSSGMKELHGCERGGNPFNLSLCAATRADSCKERKDTPGIAFSGGASPGNEITGLPLKLARPANNRAYYVAFVSTALLSPCAAKARLALHVFLSVFAKGMASCEGFVASILTINMGGFAWQRQV
ncbi:Uncharacterized protein DBV15_01692, partial [Temnothorax longispinosus]